MKQNPESTRPPTNFSVSKSYLPHCPQWMWHHTLALHRGDLLRRIGGREGPSAHFIAAAHVPTEKTSISEKTITRNKEATNGAPSESGADRTSARRTSNFTAFTSSPHQGPWIRRFHRVHLCTAGVRGTARSVAEGAMTVALGRWRRARSSAAR